MGKISDKLDTAHTELAKLVWFAEQVSSTMPRRHQLRWAVAVIEESVKESAVSAQAPDSEANAEEDYDFEDIHVRSRAPPPRTPGPPHSGARPLVLISPIPGGMRLGGAAWPGPDF